MILIAGLRLEAVLAGAVSANQPEVHVDYKDWNSAGIATPPAPFRIVLNSGTDVIILAAPTINPVREPLLISIYNKVTASVTVTVKTDDGTTEFIKMKKVLATLETLHWSTISGWYVTNA